SGSWRATRHLLIRAHGASGKVARGGHVTSSGSQPTVYRRPGPTFVLPAPRVPAGAHLIAGSLSDKEKDERGVGYVKRNAVAGRRFASWPAFEAHLAQWVREVA